MADKNIASTKLAFTKMEGAGNDYVYVDAVEDGFDLQRGSDIARVVADRHFGIGGDGLIVLLAPTNRDADVRMVMYNVDGSRGPMCGNGVRCLAKLARDRGHVAGDRVRVETDSGIRDVELVIESGAVVGARVDMGAVTVAAEATTVHRNGREWSYHAVDVGNDHAVIFLEDDPGTAPVLEVGEAMQGLAAFPNGVNVEFVHALPDGSLVQRTFERGSAETLACGSGATAAACAALQLGLVPGPSVPVQLLGGRLVIHRDGDRVVMEGPARTVFSGEFHMPIS